MSIAWPGKLRTPVIAPRVRLVVLGHYEDINSGFRASVEQWEPEITKFLIRDGENIPWSIDGWAVIDGSLPFSYSRNVNLGWAVTGTSDVILAGDDLRFDGPFVKLLQEAAYSDPTVGVATVQLHGNSPFVAGYWKRNVLDTIGKMDEQFTGYGYDDNDYCHRMELAGFHTLPVDIPCRHSGAATFFRRQAEGAVDVQRSCDHNRALYNAKWGTELK
jgi:hypothetical protein